MPIIIVKNFIEQSNRELAQLIIDRYSDYIDDYIDTPNFVIYYLKENKLESLMCACEILSCHISNLEKNIKLLSNGVFLFLYSINRNGDNIHFRYKKISIEYPIPKYINKRISKIRDQKIDLILNEKD